MKKRLIVNADDLGLSEQINHGILQAHHNGIVTSATLMMTMGGVDHALTHIHDTTLDVGLHIDLTWGRALSAPQDIPSLVNADGTFIGKKQLLKSLALGKIPSLQVEREIATQVNAFKQTGLQLFHTDVHQHFHGFPVIMRALARVAQQEDIPYIRNVNEFAPTSIVNIAMVVLFLFSKRYLPGSIRHADHFLGLALTNRLNEKSLLPQLMKVQPGLTELMCHPGYDDPLLNTLSRLQSREMEITALTSKPVRDVLTENAIELTTFRDEYQAGLTC